MFYKIARAIVRFIMRVLFKIRVEGLENIPQKGSCILCPNHKSYWDPPLMGCINRRPIYFMAKFELFGFPILGFLIKNLNAFPVKRGTSDINAIKNALKILRDGNILCIFPEGTRNNKGSGLLKGEPGAALIAIKSKSPIVPIYIHGNYKLFSKIIVRIGKPFYLECNEKLSNKQLEENTKIIMDKIAELM